MASPVKYLSKCAAMRDEDIIFGEAMLAFSQILYPDRDLNRYRHELTRVAKRVNEYYAALKQQGASDDVGLILAALKQVIEIENAYISQRENEGALLEGMSFVGLMDAGKAHCSTMAMLYCDIASRCGWQVDMMSIPSLFLLRVTYRGQVLLFDPHQNCVTLQAHTLRQRLKDEYGESVELSNDFFSSLTKKEALFHVQNVLKAYLIEREDYECALQIVRAMQVIAPDEWSLLLDVGVLYARTGQSEAAIFALRGYIEKTSDNKTRLEAQALLNDLLTMIK